MYNIVTAPPPYATNGFLTTDKGGKCSSLIKSKWDTCDADCKAQITSAIKLANKRSTAWKAPDSTKDASDHEPDCCMASYYDEVMAFTVSHWEMQRVVVARKETSIHVMARHSFLHHVFDRLG